MSTCLFVLHFSFGWPLPPGRFLAFCRRKKITRPMTPGIISNSWVVYLRPFVGFCILKIISDTAVGGLSIICYSAAFVVCPFGPCSLG